MSTPRNNNDEAVQQAENTLALYVRLALSATGSSWVLSAGACTPVAARYSSWPACARWSCS
jgi:hypothetical protein